ncbi:hypothetical protein BJF93_15275 [Xaviernesmea oryzae]|uniref:DUF2243 domain-containing protein n=1 Tax=Xaviernesmea oryzae TaxID=464029 RepID=A0A1Q9AY01_9HYPH|nr:DUF2243 domain-containing protein [Xaviernesmea oryzae]OLP60317.1 hypothetical protein BJF93_15275 [Xaviernesmea oryzae]SEK23577.1 Uncharacterized membrane protein [Xaviernesmea oryzae]
MTKDITAAKGERFSGAHQAAGFALGFGIGGFFDGILLHQVLQWHHLLSGVEQARQDIRVLILWDGLFHLLMYIIAGLGLWLLWRTRKECAETGADRHLLAQAFIGFGSWHMLDGILSHWILGIHRIRMDVDNPLFWDLLWFVLFGIVPAIFGVLIRRGGGDGKSRPLHAPLALALTIGLAGPLSALPPPDQTQVIVLFRPDIGQEEAMTAMTAIGGRLMGSDASGQLWAVDMPPGGDPFELYRHGALLVSTSLLPLGCLNWTRA